jgi:hypothetical protein
MTNQNRTQKKWHIEKPKPNKPLMATATAEPQTQRNRNQNWPADWDQMGKNARKSYNRFFGLFHNN